MIMQARWLQLLLAIAQSLEYISDVWNLGQFFIKSKSSTIKHICNSIFWLYANIHSHISCYVFILSCCLPIGMLNTMNPSIGNSERREINTFDMHLGRSMLSQRIWQNTSPSTSKSSPLQTIFPFVLFKWNTKCMSWYSNGCI